MTEPLQVGQFAIVDHEPVDRGPNAGVFHGKGPADDRAELFLVAEGTTPAGDAFAGHVVSTIGHTFATLDMSLTGALRRIFTEADRNLRDWNRKSIAQHRVSIGLTCFARRGGQAVIAQAGPSVAFHLQGGAVTALYPNEEYGRPIGLGAAVDPQLTRLDFRPGDRILVVTTPALAELDDDVIAGMLSLPAEQVLRELYQRLQHLRQLTVMMVAPRARPATTTMPHGQPVIDATGPDALLTIGAIGAPQPALDSFQPSLFIGDAAQSAVDSARRHLREVLPRTRVERVDAAVPREAAEIPAPLRRAVGDDTLTRLAAERHARATSARGSLAGGAMPSQYPQWRTPPPANVEATPLAESRQRTRRANSFSRGLVRGEPPPRPEALLEDAPLAGDLAAGRRAGAADPLSGAAIVPGAASGSWGGGGLVRVRSSMGGRWKGGGSLSRRSTVASQLPPTWLVVVIGLAILLALVGALTLPRLLREESDQRYAGLIDTAQRQLAAARVQTDPTQKRNALTEAQALLLEATESNRADLAAQQLLSEVASAIAQLDAIREPAAVDAVASLAEFGDKPVAVSRLAVGDTQAFVLDSASNAVIGLPLNGDSPAVVYREDRDAGHGRPVAVAWAENPDGHGPALLIADAGRGLWAYSESAGLRPLAFAAPANLAVMDIAVFRRELYVLDAAQSVVYRFIPSDGGFTAPPTKVLETPQLAPARRLMVDTEIITADADGSLHRFSGQLALDLSQAGIDEKLIAPSVAVPLAAGGDIAVVDAPNGRVVVLHRDGSFSHQYRHQDFQGISALAIQNGVAYVFSGGGLRRVTW